VTAHRHRKARSIPKAAVVAMLALASPGTWALDLESVLEKTAVSPPARVAFREERHNPLLREPMVLTGYLEYIEAGRLRKVVETPFREAFLIDTDHIEVERGGETRTVSLKTNRLLRTMLGGIEAILAGRTDFLSSIFDYELSGTASSWSLRLVPLSRKVSRHLTGMLITGDDTSICSIRFEMKEDEWQLMEIMHPALQP